jgi:hypothetical protein
MKIIITKKQLNLLNESRIHDLDHLYDSLILKLKKIEYIPGENLGYNFIRRIGKYLQDKDLIHEILVKSIYDYTNDLMDAENGIELRRWIDCKEMSYDVILDISDKILYYYEDEWNADNGTEELADIFDQIRNFLYVIYGEIINDFCKNI